MRLCNLAVDDEFILNGVKFYVHDIKAPNISFYREDGDKKIRELNYMELISDPTFQIPQDMLAKYVRQKSNEEKKVSYVIDTLLKERKDITNQRLKWIKPVLLYDQAKQGDMYAINSFHESYKEFLKGNESVTDLTKTELLDRIEKKTGKSKRQLQRYLSSYYDYEQSRENHGVEGLISKAHLNIHNRNDEKAIEICHPKKEDIVLDVIYSRLDKDYIPLIKQAIKLYLSKKRRMISHVHHDLELLCTAEKLTPLLYDTVYKLVTRINSQVYDRLKRGVMDSEYNDPVTNKSSGYIAMTPLHVIEIDHVKLPIKVIDEDTGYDLGEPWLTLAIDVYTRKIWGFDLSFQSPSGIKVMNCLFNGICLKRSIERFGTLNEWEIHGIPTVIYMDNGSDFTSAYVKSMIEDELHAEVRYRPIATPRYGGIIERFFRTINDEFLAELLGFYKKGDNAEDRHEASKEAILTLNDLRELLVRYIVDVYHFDTHRGLPLDQDTPAVRYYHAIDTMGYPKFIREEDEELYLIKLLPSKMKSYKKDGIRENNVRYASPETSRFVNSRKKNNCKIKYDARDISKVYLLDNDNKIYVEVPSISPPAEEVKGMSRDLYEAIRKELIKQGKINKQQIPGTASIIEGKRLIRERYNVMIKKSAPMRKHALNKGGKLSVTYPMPANKNTKTVSKKQLFIDKYNNQRNSSST